MDRDLRNRNNRIGELVMYAKSRYGKEYTNSAEFIRECYDKVGVKIPNTSIQQSHVGRKIGFYDMIPGDLIFFCSNNYCIDNVGLYVGNGMFIHITKETCQVATSCIVASYYKSKYVLSKRIIK